eukprot:TRINITY_DN1582_c0_g1_i1.p1 TRINITY_DN1582_c0_g1~~TRINITY_DN1582_c0_g1_i1.p1  ORF type:complete len:276 (-),score=79.90 TRINITY_DN1582_c0_g1_i1:486-1313(-)
MDANEGFHFSLLPPKASINSTEAVPSGGGVPNGAPVTEMKPVTKIEQLDDLQRQFQLMMEGMQKQMAENEELRRKLRVENGMKEEDRTGSFAFSTDIQVQPQQQQQGQQQQKQQQQQQVQQQTLAAPSLGIPPRIKSSGAPAGQNVVYSGHRRVASLTNSGSFNKNREEREEKDEREDKALNEKTLKEAEATRVLVDKVMKLKSEQQNFLESLRNFREVSSELDASELSVLAEKEANEKKACDEFWKNFGEYSKSVMGNSEAQYVHLKKALNVKS